MVQSIAHHRGGSARLFYLSLFLLSMVSILLLVTQHGAAAASSITLLSGSIDQETNPTLNFSLQYAGLDQTTYNSTNVMILQVTPSTTAMWGNTMRPFLLSMIPTNIFVLKMSPQQLASYVLAAPSSVEYVNIFPSELKQSPRLQYFLHQQALTLRDSTVYENAAIALASSSSNTTDTVQKYSRVVDDLQAQINTTTVPSAVANVTSATESASFNTLFYSLFDQNSLPLDDAAPQSSSSPVSQSTAQLTQNQLKQMRRQRYVHDTSTLSFSGLAHFDKTSQLVGMMQYSGTYHLEALLTADPTSSTTTQSSSSSSSVPSTASVASASVKQSSIEPASTTSAASFTQASNNILDTINRIHTSFATPFIAQMSDDHAFTKHATMNLPTHSTLAADILPAARRFQALFSSQSISTSAFLRQLAVNMRAMGGSPSSTSSSSHSATIQSQYDATILSLLPLNPVLQVSTRSINAQRDSTVPLAFLHVQLQSPLFTQQSATISKILATRVSSLLSAYSTSNSDAKHSTLSNQGTASSASLDLHQLRTDIMNQYRRQEDLTAMKLDQASGRGVSRVQAQGTASTLSASEKEQLPLMASADRFNGQVSSEFLSRATLVQYIDILALSMLEAHQQDRSAAQQSTFAASSASSAAVSIAALPQKHEMVALLSSFVDVQMSTLSNVVTDITHSIAQRPDVHFVDKKLPVSVQNKNLRWEMELNTSPIASGSSQPTGFSLLGPYIDAGVNGDGIIVGVSDTGVDVNACWFYDSATVPFVTSATSVANSSHSKFAAYYGYENQIDETDGDGHGSHVCGTILGQPRSQSSASLITTTSTQTWSGIAPYAKIAFFDIGDDAGNLYLPTDIGEIFNFAYLNGARLHSNSWGCSVSPALEPMWACNAYDTSAFQVDHYLNEYQGMTISFAAGNDGAYIYGSIGSTAISKSALVVGALSAPQNAVQDTASSSTTTTPYTQSPSTYNALDVVMYFSSTGPSFDGRIKPDVSAPGTYVTSAASAAVSSTTDTTSYSCATTVMSGTSMATPATTGTLSLMKQMLQQGTGRGSAAVPFTPSGPLLKALAINSAQSVGYRGITSSPDPAPLAAQSATSATSTYNGQTYTLLPAGTFPVLSSLTTTTSAYLYLTPSALPTDPPAGASADYRVFRVMVFVQCSGTVSFSAVLQDGTSPIASHTFSPQSASADPRDYVDIAVSTSDTVYLTLTVAAATSNSGCDTSGAFSLGALEFAANSDVSDAPHYIAATCTTTFDDLPQWSTTSLYTPDWAIRCPAAPACNATYYPNSDVTGTNYYGIDSPICPAALHAGAINATAPATGETAADQFVQLFVSQYSGSTVTLSGIEHNGVTSSDLKLTSSTWYYRLQPIGQPLPNTTDVTNPYLYLSILPAGPNTVSGFGRINIGTVLPLVDDIVSTSSSTVARELLVLANADLSTEAVDETVTDAGLTHHSVQSQCFTVSTKTLASSYQESSETGTWSSGDDDLRVSMAWYDLAGSNVASKLLVNDLDLFLYTPDGSEYRGNERADHRNTVERVVLAADSFSPGMYCVVQYGVYVPIGTQLFATAVSGRGVALCGSNPLSVDLSGLWATTSSPTCSNSVTASSPFIMSQSSVRLRQGGDCLSIYTPIASVSSDVTTFNDMRVSDPALEDALKFDAASAAGNASYLNPTEGSITASIVSSSSISGFLYPAANSQQADAIDVSIVYDDDAKTVTITLNNEDSCQYVYSQTSSSGSAVFNVSNAAVNLEPVPTDGSTNSASFLTQSSIVMIIVVAAMLLLN